MAYAHSDEFIQICYECDFNSKAIAASLKQLYPSYDVRPYKIEQRIANYRRKGLLPLPSGNSVATGQVLKSTSTLYDETGKVKLQWLKSDVPREQFLDAFKSVIEDLASTLPALSTVATPSLQPQVEDLATLYISNDLHIGSLMDKDESGTSWDTERASAEIRKAYDYLFACSPTSSVGIVVDLGDLLEVNDTRNVTPKSGHVLSVDSRFYKILRTAYEALIYGINKALEKHETVYFYNIGGNHDEVPSIAIREVIRMAFQNNPRVIIDDTPTSIKYHQHGEVLLQFAHGHAMKKQKAGETMAADMQHIFSSTKFRFSHLGHVHSDSVYDSAICRVESHRNLAPLNHYAYEYGYRTNGNTMKSITYHKHQGEVSRQTYNVCPTL